MKRVFPLLLFVLGLPGGLMAAKVIAHVVDPEGGPLQGVESKLVNTTTGAEKYGTSSATGEIAFVDVPPGSYKLMGRKPGYGSGESKPVTITDADATVELKLLSQAVMQKMMDKASSAFKKKKYEEATQQ